MKKIRVPLLAKAVITITVGVLFGQFSPGRVAYILVTFNSLFGNSLSFSIPLIILGLVTPAIGDLGKGAGKLLLMTALIAYGSAVFSSFFAFPNKSAISPHVLPTSAELMAMEDPGDFMLAPHFVINMLPLMDVTTASLLSFTVGLGLSNIVGVALCDSLVDFKEIIIKLIEVVIIPLLPLHIFGIFLNVTVGEQVISIITMFLKVVIVIFASYALLLLIQFMTTRAIAGKNPLRLLKNTLPAYTTVLGIRSPTAMIPVTLAQAVKSGVRENITIFTVPLYATIHLTGSTMKIVTCVVIIMIMAGKPATFSNLSGFAMILEITMVAAPGAPGGAIMAALGILQSMLGFNGTLQTLATALHIAIDGFGTACNMMGDGTITVVVDEVAGENIP